VKSHASKLYADTQAAGVDIHISYFDEVPMAIG
jgi:hypothetical protein